MGTAACAADRKAARNQDRDTTRHGQGDAPAGDDAYRILVVEDDRSQAVFAETVLQGAGMRTCTAATADEARAALEAFAPDLVLMDLHLPGTSGAELTAAIRAQPAHAQLPIVFLTGDPDPETEYRMLEGGADDCLAKPIRPRHLVSAVHNRVQRARQARAASGGGGQRDPATGLYRRDYLLPRLAQAGAALLLEIQNLPLLRERLGYTGVEDVLRRAGNLLAGLAPDAARLNDNSFLVLDAQADEAARAALARRLREGLAQPIEHAGMPLRVRAVVAHMALEGEAARDPLAALERTLRRARGEASGVAGYEDPGNPARAAARSALRAALEGDRLELAYQPIAAVAGGDEAQFQVLLRMRDAHGALHCAGEFIAQAEEAGLLGELDRRVLELALARLRPDARPRARCLFVSHSPQAIAADPDGARLRAMLEAGGVAPSSLVVDLRLDDALVHELAIAGFCRALAPLGVAFCLGQYVHGDAAAALMRQLPLSYLRLAPRYARQDAEPAVREELRALIHAAHAAGLRVIGAQVESASAAAALWMGGVDYIQGNLVQGAGSELDFDFQHSVL